MFKHLKVLLRGKLHEAEEAFEDRNALPILSQQVREAARGLDTARRALALAIAQAGIEKENSARLAGRIADLEERALTALAKGREDLAAEAARSIAFLEAELASARKAESEFSAGIEKLRQAMQAGEGRLSALRRGERLAVARDRAQRLAHEVPGNEAATLTDAEATLARLERRQKQTDMTAEALTGLLAEDPAAVVRKLADAGCGAPAGPTGDDVLARLRARLATNSETH